MDKMTEEQVRARLDEAQWSLDNLASLKGTTFQAGVVWQNQYQRIRLLQEMLDDFGKEEGYDS